jgi:hypothetical protein
MFPQVLGNLRVPRIGGSRPRPTPDRALGDKAYSSKANRLIVRDRNIHAVIPALSDQIAHRKRRDRAGGRPPGLDKEGYKRQYDKRALTYRGGAVLSAITI